jgi:hypothetical protein
VSSVEHDTRVSSELVKGEERVQQQEEEMVKPAQWIRNGE